MYSSPTRGLKQSVDWKLVICYLLLVIIGWLNIFAANHSVETGSIVDFASRSGKQFIWIIISTCIATLILFVLNPRLWEILAIPTYVLIFCLLVGVIFVGSDIKGSHSWFTLGPVSFQPAEVSKIASSLVLAAVMSRTGFKMTNIKDLLLSLAVIGLPMMAIVAENETGSALVYLGFVFVFYREGLSGWILVFAGMSILLFILTLTVSPFVSILILISLISLIYSLQAGKMKLWILAGIPSIVLMCFLPKIFADVPGERLFNIAAIIGICAIPAAVLIAFRKKKQFIFPAVIAFLAGIIVIFSTNFVFNKILQEHQRSRIEVLLGMKDDPKGVGYNVNQSMIAIGSGGLTGKGFLKGTQTTYGFVPEQSTDFIFCTIGEEWGFLGCLVVILLYIFLIYRIVNDAESSREPFTRIYGYCVASLIFMHLFINIGMTIGLMPVIGIPLPLVSYGGSSLLSFTVLVFIFIALDHQENKYF